MNPITYHRKKTQGLCVQGKCGNPAVQNRARCLEHSRAAVIVQTQKHQRRVALGICVKCKAPATHGQMCQTHRLIARRMSAKQRYHLTEVELQALEERAGGRCMICHDETRLVVDHDHNTGRIRGLLCVYCNVTIGHLPRLTQLQDEIQQYLTEETE